MQKKPKKTDLGRFWAGPDRTGPVQSRLDSRLVALAQRVRRRCRGCTLGFSTIPNAMATSKTAFGASFCVFSGVPHLGRRRRPTPFAIAGVYILSIRRAECNGGVEIIFRRVHGEIYVGVTLGIFFYLRFPPPWLAAGEATAARWGT